jgi:hypothetical protein
VERVYRLHESRRTGQIKSFIFPYLGQLDRQLPNPPANLVRREEAHAYPADFNAMPDEWIERLSLRGEQLTLCLGRVCARSRSMINGARAAALPHWVPACLCAPHARLRVGEIAPRRR